MKGGIILKLGVAFCGNDPLHCTSEILRQFQQYHIVPHAYAATSGMFFPLLLGIFPDCPHEQSEAKKYFKRRHITKLSQLPVPILICEKNLLTGNPLYTGNLPHKYDKLIRENDQDIWVLLRRFQKKFPAQFQKQLITDRYIKEHHLLLGLNLLNSEKYLLIQMNSSKEGFYRHNPHYSTLHINTQNPNQLLEKYLLQIYNFLYFHE